MDVLFIQALANQILRNPSTFKPERWEVLDMFLLSCLLSPAAD